MPMGALFFVRTWPETLLSIFEVEACLPLSQLLHCHGDLYKQVKIILDLRKFLPEFSVKCFFQERFGISKFRFVGKSCLNLTYCLR